ncbi:RDD family protein [Jeotgalibacillus sp. ET6]|uniref:RDD family protein n=1 Tax=Jeotgalibacillus sp. ET6 TaxID=3037260 RepID=UPI0024189692|nr:RDD family protein [Jeotgalibacillus sp. ET6]MDG5471072.1 RDD family protein [Jeotgalibacillus sp. ET6]
MDYKDEQMQQPLPPEEEQVVKEEKPSRNSQHPEYVTPHYSGFWMRVWAYLFDLLVIAAINGLLIYPVLRLTGSMDSSGVVSIGGIATSITFLAYFVLMTKFFGQTLGKMVFGLRVRSVKESSLTWTAVLFRELIGRYVLSIFTIFGLPVFLFLYAVVAFTPKKQGLHDFIGDTAVVHERTVVAAVKSAYEPTSHTAERY